MRTPHKRLSVGVLALVAAGSMIFAAAALAHGRGDNHGRHHGDDHLITQNLLPSKAGTPAAPAIVIFGVNPGGVDWLLGRGEAKLRSDGRIKVRVRGLVLATGPNAGTAGPVTTITASLFCNGTKVGTTAPPAPLAQNGDGKVSGQFTLPATCIAPTVMVNPNGNAATYIAITGFSLQQGDDDD